MKYAAVGLAGSTLVRSLHATCRVTTEGAEHWTALRDRERPWVFTIWHGTMLSPIWQHRGEGVIALVSEHRDGEYITRIIERLGYGTARGSSTRGGSKGLREMLRAARSGRTLAVTPDGPKGPPERVKPGVLVAAQRGEMPIVSVGVGISRAWRFDSWDRFAVPKPFARIHLVYGAPISVPRDADPETLDGLAAELEASMHDVTARARSAVGEERELTPPPPVGPGEG